MNIEDMVPVSDTEELLISARGQVDCRECLGRQVEPAERDWYWGDRGKEGIV